MREEFKLRTKPFSINASTYRDASIKTAEFRNWASQIFYQLNTDENLKKMKNIRENFDESRHSIKLEICAIYPRSEFITKNGILSSRTIDVTNFEKLICDLIFDRQYFDKPNPYGVKNCCINDKHVTEMVSKKIFHEHRHHTLEFNINIIPRSF